MNLLESLLPVHQTTPKTAIHKLFSPSSANKPRSLEPLTTRTAPEATLAMEAQMFTPHRTFKPHTPRRSGNPDGRPKQDIRTLTASPLDMAHNVEETKYLDISNPNHRWPKANPGYGSRPEKRWPSARNPHPQAQSHKPLDQLSLTLLLIWSGILGGIPK